jgi:hypothetical protein
MNMDNPNLHMIRDELLENAEDLDENFQSQIAAADLVLTILGQSAWQQQGSNANRLLLHTNLDSWHKSGPFSSQKWSTTTTAIAWQPLSERAKTFYEYMELEIGSCIERIKDDDRNYTHLEGEPEYPLGRMSIFCELVRLIMGTVDYTPLATEYRAMTAEHRYVLSEPNPVKVFLQHDPMWMQLLKDVVAYVYELADEIFA